MRGMIGNVQSLQAQWLSNSAPLIRHRTHNDLFHHYPEGKPSPEVTGSGVSVTCLSSYYMDIHIHEVPHWPVQSVFIFLPSQYKLLAFDILRNTMFLYVLHQINVVF